MGVAIFGHGMDDFHSVNGADFLKFVPMPKNLAVPSVSVYVGLSRAVERGGQGGQLAPGPLLDRAPLKCLSFTFLT